MIDVAALEKQALSLDFKERGRLAAIAAEEPGRARKRTYARRMGTALGEGVSASSSRNGIRRS